MTHILRTINNRWCTPVLYNRLLYSTISKDQRKSIQEGPSLHEFIENEALVRQPQGKRLRLPPWLKTEIPTGKSHHSLKKTLRSLNLATVCEEAKCPNIGECWGGKEGTATATIMILGIIKMFFITLCQGFYQSTDILEEVTSNK